MAVAGAAFFAGCECAVKPFAEDGRDCAMATLFVGGGELEGRPSTAFAFLVAAPGLVPAAPGLTPPTAPGDTTPDWAVRSAAARESSTAYQKSARRR